jgi:hypothetical protein
MDLNKVQQLLDKGIIVYGKLEYYDDLNDCKSYDLHPIADVRVFRGVLQGMIRHE